MKSAGRKAPTSDAPVVSLVKMSGSHTNGHEVGYGRCAGNGGGTGRRKAGGGLLARQTDGGKGLNQIKVRNRSLL